MVRPGRAQKVPPGCARGADCVTATALRQWAVSRGRKAISLMPGFVASADSAMYMSSLTSRRPTGRKEYYMRPMTLTV
jgi:hypothetical protein